MQECVHEIRNETTLRTYVNNFKIKFFYKEKTCKIYYFVNLKIKKKLSVFIFF